MLWEGMSWGCAGSLSEEVDRQQRPQQRNASGAPDRVVCRAAVPARHGVLLVTVLIVTIWEIGIP
jgi:hypothetical protein